MAPLTPAPRLRGFRTSIAGLACARATWPGLAGGLALLLGAAPAAAQVAANVTLASNQLFRGETISADDPGLALAVSADLPGGLFAGADASFAAGGEAPRLTAANLYAGVALRLGEASVEAGAIHRRYGSIYDDAYRPRFTELYAGITLRRVQVRAFVSPDYLADGRNTYYLDVNARLASLGRWTLQGHGGLALIPHDLGDPDTSLISYEDWSLRASRPLGPFTLGLGVAGTNYPVFGPSGKVRFSAQLSRAF
ncbi:TorF family putative porin [Novosphingobium bradum]|uniref:TorF family putative porin n=1 Tax=Novosphingobium bradum TaxID=1737444 RepID=A0ABV7IY06_9SPHN